MYNKKVYVFDNESTYSNYEHNKGYIKALEKRCKLRSKADIIEFLNALHKDFVDKRIHKYDNIILSYIDMIKKLNDTIRYRIVPDGSYTKYIIKLFSDRGEYPTDHFRSGHNMNTTVEERRLLNWKTAFHTLTIADFGSLVNKNAEVLFIHVFLDSETYCGQTKYLESILKTCIDKTKKYNRRINYKRARA